MDIYYDKVITSPPSTASTSSLSDFANDLVSKDKTTSAELIRQAASESIATIVAAVTNGSSLERNSRLLICIFLIVATSAIIICFICCCYFYCDRRKATRAASTLLDAAQAMQKCNSCCNVSETEPRPRSHHDCAQISKLFKYILFVDCRAS